MAVCIKDTRFLPPGSGADHGFFGRKGGVSAGVYDSLNCALNTADDSANVQENRDRVRLAIGANTLLTVRQVHGRTCHVASGPWTQDVRPEGDAMVTDVPGLALGVLSADCGPVLFYGQRVDGAPVIGAAHAGWGGALGGVLESTVEVMLRHNVVAASLRASLGPCIGRRSYEVGTDFTKPFLEQDEANEHFFQPARRDGHLMFDLPGYIASRLAAAGVRQASILDHDTYAEEDTYFSYRRATHAKTADYGRQISAIVIKP